MSPRACSIHGNAAAIVAGVARTPGRISRAKARVGGNASLSDASAPLAFSSVGASSRIEARRFDSSDASAAIVVLKLDTSSPSCTSLRTSPAAALAAPSISRARSCSGSSPSSASLTCASERSAGPMSS